MSKPSLVPQEPRVIDPGSPLEKQTATLLALIKNPPENSRIITFSPELADWILADNLNHDNRKPRPSRIKRYSLMMGRGDWVLSGDTIKFSRSKLLDGQNRLMASVASNTAFRTHVVFGIDQSAFDVIDSGKSRTPKDTLYTAGVPNSEVVTPAVRWLMIHASGNLEQRGLTFSNQEVLQFWNDKVNQDDLQAAVGWTAGLSKTIPRGNLAFLLYLFNQKHTQTRAKFVADLRKPKLVGKKLPEKFKRLRIQSMGRLHETQINALIIQAWNHYRDGKPVNSLADLNWTEAKDFPEIK